VRPSSLTDLVFVVNKSSTKESASTSALPHVNARMSTLSNLASWKFSNTEFCREAPFLEDVEWSANWFTSWNAWVNCNFSTVIDPSFSLESVPLVVYEFEDVSIMMPVALVPGPA